MLVIVVVRPVSVCVKYFVTLVSCDIALSGSRQAGRWGVVESNWSTIQTKLNIPAGLSSVDAYSFDVSNPRITLKPIANVNVNATRRLW